MMTTVSQCLYGVGREKKRPSSRTYKLRKNPQILGIIKRMFIMSPKKPNAGKRRVAKVNIKRVARLDRLTARIVGYDYLLRKFAHVLSRGGRANDTPGVTYSCIRGSLDFMPHYNKTRRRSFYGIKREELKDWKMIFIKRTLRQQYAEMESYQKEQALLKKDKSFRAKNPRFMYRPGLVWWRLSE